MKAHAIFGAADANCGDFLIDHWLVSLRENVDLASIDVHVLDYGLSSAQRDRLKPFCVFHHLFPKDGWVANLRIRDQAAVLQKYNYDQVMACDAGDLIFQADVSHLFEKDKSAFRAVCEEIDSSIHELIMSRDDLRQDQFRKMIDFLKGKPTINVGVLLGPSTRFRELWDAFICLSAGVDAYGTEQLIINYKLYREGFVALESQFNFVLLVMHSRFAIVNGVFYDGVGDVISIVHNAGRKNWQQAVSSFGYGRNFNKRKIVMPRVMRFLFSVMRLYRGFLGLMPRHRDSVE